MKKVISKYWGFALLALLLCGMSSDTILRRCKLVDSTGINMDNTNPLHVNDFYFDIATLNIPGYTTIRKFSNNPELNNGVQEDVWNFGETYVYLTAPTTLYASSSDNTDTQEITVTGLDSTGLLQTQSFNLTGQTQVALPSTWTSVNSGYNSDSIDLAGSVYVAESDTTTGGVPDTDSKVKLFILQSAQQTLMCQYKIPSDKHGVFTSLSVTIQKNQSSSVDFEILIRETGGVFRTQAIVGVQSTGNSAFLKNLVVPVLLPPGTDLVIRATANANSVAVSMSYEIILVDSALINHE